MSKNETDCVTCPHCQGRGTLPLPRHLHETLDYLRKRGLRTAPQLKDALMSEANGTTGMNNRLTALEKMGLVKKVPSRLVQGAASTNKACYWAPTSQDPVSHDSVSRDSVSHAPAED
jgi:hypothetical protein